MLWRLMASTLLVPLWRGLPNNGLKPTRRG
jgi:hypothetical protein